MRFEKCHRIRGQIANTPVFIIERLDTQPASSYAHIGARALTKEMKVWEWEWTAAAAAAERGPPFPIDFFLICSKIFF
jgi:hypothetical protein